MNPFQKLVLFSALMISSDVIADEHWNQFGGPQGDFEIRSGLSWSRLPPTKRWQRTLGDGMSGVVLHDGMAFTCYLKPIGEEQQEQPESERVHREVVIALNADNGETQWQHEYEAGRIEDQQAFGGRARAPQATPAVCGDHLVTVGFTGKTYCLNRWTGAVVWEKDLVQEFEAVPVQFGFSASPIPYEGNVILLAGGRKGGLVSLSVATGETNWSVPCNEASYATPVIWKRTDETMVVFVTRNRVVGVDATAGTFLWEFQLPGAGMTNVPTPMLIDQQDILVSGQGIKGTLRLRIRGNASGYEVSRIWSSNEQFFYCNWIRRDNVVIACDGDLMKLIDLETGQTIGRFRGYNDSNSLMGADRMLTLHGDGHLSLFELEDDRMNAIAKYYVFGERCWTPPTLASDRLYCRGGDQLLCLDLAGGDPRAAVSPVRIRKPVLDFADGPKQSERKLNALQSILTAFEKDGAESAWKTYNEARQRDPDSLSYDERKKLTEMANEQGLHEFAKLLELHSREDFPVAWERERATQNPSSETRVNENGLVYLEFSIRNTTKKTIQAFVEGPAKHPFSYGLPLPPGKARLEKWPVGTTLYRTESGIRKESLLQVRREIAGQVIDLPQRRASTE